MKIAILGSGSHALEMVEYLENIGAFVKWFAEDTQHQKAINKKVKRVHKRFLNCSEIPEASRLTDLFRVVFEQNPEAEITQQMQSDNAGIFEKLTPFEMDYLKSRFESFEDFDLIINLPHKKSFYRYAGPAGVPAVGELQVENVDYTHGKWRFEDSVREVAILGEQASNKENLKYLSKWLIDGAGHKRAFYITDGANPLSHSQCLDSLNELEAHENKRAEVFLEKLRQWQKLEDYEKAKVPRPEDPIPLLVYFTGHNITAMSKLSDQDRLYLTCETPHWRIALKGEDNSRQPLKTIAVDKLIVANGYQYRNHLFMNMRKPISNISELDNESFEPGLLELDLDETGCYYHKSSNQLMSELEKIIHYYFMEKE